jgi:hypothetical protein
MEAMKRAFLLLFFSLFFGQSMLHAGDSIHMKRYPSSVGFGYIYPLLKNGINAGPWTSINWRNNWFEVSYSYGDVNFKESPTDLNVTHVYGMDFGIGAHIPFLKHTIGSHTHGGFMLNPTLDIDFGSMGANLGNGDYNSSFSMTLAPGVDLHFPYFYVGFSLCLTYNMYLGGGPDSGVNYTTEEKVGYLGMKGFLIYPKLTFQLNSMSSIVHARRIKRGEIYYSSVSFYTKTSSIWAYDMYGNYLPAYDVYTETSTIPGGWKDAFSYIVSSYVGFKGGLQFQRVHETKGATFMPSVGGVLRAGPIALDATEAWGKIGMDSPANMTLKNNYVGNILSATTAIDICNLIGAIRAHNISKGTAGFAKESRAGSVDDKSAIHNRNPLFDTHKFRLLFGYRFSFLTLHPVINSSYAVPANAINGNATGLYKPMDYNFSYTRNFYVAVEVSTISLSWDFLPADYYPYASGTMLGISWHLPLKMWNQD